MPLTCDSWYISCVKTGPRGRDKQEDIKSPRICRNLGEGFEHMWGEGDGIQTGTVVAMDRETPVDSLVTNAIQEFSCTDSAWGKIHKT